MVVNVGRERRGDGTESLDARDEVVRDNRAVLKPKAWIAPRAFLLQAFVNAQCGVTATIPVRMSADLPARQVRFAADRVELFLGHNQDAVIIRSAFVRRGESRRALGDRAVANELHCSDANPFIPN